MTTFENLLQHQGHNVPFLLVKIRAKPNSLTVFRHPCLGELYLRANGFQSVVISSSEKKKDYSNYLMYFITVNFTYKIT